jgi:MFS-type transporter involved in bile tolerance (Atg22 family)
MSTTMTHKLRQVFATMLVLVLLGLSLLYLFPDSP